MADWHNLLSGNFIPHGHCYLWKPELVWLHILSDSTIALAYYSIPLMLVYFVRKRRDIPFDWIFLLFGTFIIACGSGHLIDVWTLWHPDYWLAGGLKAITAFVSAYTALQLVPLIPQALALPSPAQLEAANGKLEREIIERQRVEEELIKERDFSQTLVQTCPAFFVAIDADGKTITMNESMLAALGYTHDEVAGKEYLSNFVPECDRQELSQIFGQLVQRRQPTRNENRVLTKEGQELSIEWHGRPVYKESGEFDYFFGMGIDITERQIADEKIRFQANLLNVVEQAVIATDLNGIVIYWNQFAGQLYGWSPTEALGKNILDLTPSNASKSQAAELMSHLKEGKSWSGEFIVQHRDGTTFPIIVTDSPIYDEKKTLCGIVGISFDLSDRQRTEAALQEQIRRNQIMLEATMEGFLKVRLDGKILETNPAFSNIVGYAREELVNMSIDDLEALQTPEETARHIETVRQMGSDRFQTQHRCKDDRIVDLEASVTLVNLGADSFLFSFVRDITERKQAEAALRRSEAKYKKLAQQEKLINWLACQIRNSLDLDTILETTVREIRDLLQIDRCNFTWYRRSSESSNEINNCYWEVVKEARNPDLPSLLGIYPAQDISPLTKKLLDLEMLRADEVENLNDRELREGLLSFGCTSILALPIKTKLGEIGIVTCSHANGYRPWNDSEVELLQAVSDRVAIAINQAELYAQSREATRIARAQAQQIEQALHQLQQTQTQLIQSEKMSSLGQLVAGVAHEINNPVSFIYGNLNHANEYIQDLLSLVQLYQHHYPNPETAIQTKIEAIDIDFLKADLLKLLSSMKVGADRIRQIVLSLRNFSRLDEAQMKPVDIHEGIDSTLLILQNRLKETSQHPAIQIIKEYGKLPPLPCYAGQLNQVFMNVICNAIDVLEEVMEHGKNEEMPIPTIRIKTEVKNENYVVIRIADNGYGMTEDVCQKLFDPFFTTKPVGKGTGLGLSISYQIVVEKHGGKLQCISAPNRGAEFIIELPIRLRQPSVEILA